VLGTIAGDDTVFVAAKSKAHAMRIFKRIRDMAGWSEAKSPSSRF
jgi:arginine repressor